MCPTLEVQTAAESDIDDEAILQINPTRDPSWDSDIACNPAATPFHTSAWASVLSKSFGFEPCYLTKRHRDGSRSLLPMMEINSWITGRRGASLPFTDECVPLVRDGAAFTSLFNHAVRLGNARRWRYLELRGGSNPIGGAHPSGRFWGHRLDLRGHDPLENVAASVRQAVRKAIRNGVAVESGAGEGPTSEFYALMCKTRRRHGVPPQPFKFFKALDELIISPGKGLLLLARRGRRAIAGALFLIHGRRAIFKFGASDSGHQALRPNNLVMWEAITRLSSLGIESLDMGRTSTSNDGLRNFKLSWGAEERTIDYLRFDLRRSSFVEARDMSSGAHCRIFRALPLPISRAFGTFLYKHAA